MSKKNKNKEFDPFNMSFEEAKQTASLINELVKGEDVSIGEIMNNDVDYNNDRHSTFTSQLNEFVNNMINETCDDNVVEKTTEHRYSVNDDEMNITSIDITEAVNNTNSTNMYVKSDNIMQTISDGYNYKVGVINDSLMHGEESVIGNDNVLVQSKSFQRAVSFKYNKLFNKMVIDDDIFETVIDIDDALNSDVDITGVISEYTDADELCSIYSEFYYYIVTRKVPTLIIPADKFEIEFGIYSELSNHYVFFKKDENVFMYIVPESDALYKPVHMCKSSDILKYIIYTARECNKSATVFDSESNDLINVLIKDSIRILPGIINTGISLEPETKYANHNTSAWSEVWKNLRVLDYDEFVKSVESKFNNRVIDEDDIPDIDDNDLPSLNDEDDDNSTYPEISEFDHTPRLSTPFHAEEIETGNNKDKPISNDDSMIMPVIHRKK